MEIQRLQEEIRRRDEYQRAQEQFMKEQQEYWFRVQSQQQAAIQVSMNVNTLHSTVGNVCSHAISSSSGIEQLGAKLLPYTPTSPCVRTTFGGAIWRDAIR